MAGSRTGTTAWLNISRYMIREAQERGQARCVYCPVTLDYENRRSPNGAQVDHRIPHSKGGSDDPQNLVVCCANCNQSKSNRAAPKPKTVMAHTPLKTSRKW